MEEQSYARVREENSSLENKNGQIKDLEETQLRNFELLGAKARFIDTEKKPKDNKPRR